MCEPERRRATTTQEHPPQIVTNALRSVQFVVGQDGQQTGVFLDMATWEALLDWLEDVEDRTLVKDLLPRLREGPGPAGAYRWDQVEADWQVEFAQVT